MEVFWAFLAVLVFVVLVFWVFPAMLPSPPVLRPVSAAVIDLPLPGAAPTPARAPSAAEKARRALDQQFAESTARPEVPEDYPRKVIGTCPFSKPPSSDLPLADVPMCLVKNEASMGPSLRLPYTAPPCPPI